MCIWAICTAMRVPRCHVRAHLDGHLDGHLDASGRSWTHSWTHLGEHLGTRMAPHLGIPPPSDAHRVAGSLLGCNQQYQSTPQGG